MLGANEMNISWQNKNIQNKKPTNERIQCIQPINAWVERSRREQYQHVTRMDAERLVKISKDNIPVGR